MLVPMPPMPPVTYATRCVINLLRYRYEAPTGHLFPCLMRDVDTPRAESARRARASLRTLDRQRDAHAAADTQRRQTLLRIALLHFVQQRNENPAARCTDRMADRNR